MKPLRLLALLLPLILLASCAHRAREIKPPDAGPLQAKSRELTAAVTKSRAAVREASGAVADARESHKAEMKHTEEISDRVDAFVMAVPPELEQQATDLLAELRRLQIEQQDTERALNHALTAQALATAELEKANAVKNEAEQLAGAYTAEVEAMAERADKAEKAWAKDSKALQWYRLHWWGAWIVLCAGIAACALWTWSKIAARAAVRL